MYSASWDIRIFRVSKWKSIVKEKGLPAAALFAEEITRGRDLYSFNFRIQC